MLNRRLVTYGHEVHAATLWRSNRSDWLRGTTVSAPSPSPDDVIDGVVVHNLGLSRRRRVLSAPFAAIYYGAMRQAGRHLTELYLPQAEETVRSFDPTVAHLSRIGREWFYEAFVQVLEARAIPFVLTPYHHPHWHRRRDRWWWSLYRRADGICVFTEFERRALVAGGVQEERIVRVPSGPVDALVERREVTQDGTGPVVLFLGQVKPYKGLSILYAAMSSVWKHHPDAELVVVGPWTRERRGLRQQLDEDHRVRVLGAVSQARKWAELSRASVLCLPSTEESLGIVYLEAWQVEKPVIGADIPPVRELFDRTGGGIVARQEPGEVAQALLSVLSDPQLSRRLGSAGRSAVTAEFNWDVAAQRTEALYQSVLGQGR